MTGRTTRRLTDPGIAKLKPRRTEYIVWDSRVAGLGVRVRPSGRRSFVWHGHANDRAVRKTVGPAALMTIEDARRECVALRSGIQFADNGNERSQIPLFRDFVMGEWKPAAGSRWSAARRRSVVRMLERQLLPAFGARRLDRLLRVDVERWFDAYSRTAPGGANNGLQLLRQIMKAALATGQIAADPTRGIKRKGPTYRSDHAGG